MRMLMKGINGETSANYKNNDDKVDKVSNHCLTLKLLQLTLCFLFSIAQLACFEVNFSEQENFYVQ